LFDLLRSKAVQIIVIAMLCTIATWNDNQFVPGTGLDWSWTVGLNMAFTQHLAWGPQMDFTYGPLGFLTLPTLLFGKTAALALVYTGLLNFTTFALLIYWTRRSFTLLYAVLISYVVGTTTIFLVNRDLILVPATMLAMLCLEQHAPGRKRIGIALVGVTAGVGILIKFSDGVIALVVLLVVVLASDSRRHLVINAAVGAATFSATLLVGWVGTGNSVGNLGSFIHNAIDIAGGNSSAMQYELGSVDDWWYALLVVGLVATFATLRLRWIRGRVRAASIVILLVVTWWALKEAFVRYDAQHNGLFFGFMLILLPLLPVATSRWRQYMAAALAFLTLVAWTASGFVPANLLAVRKNSSGLRSEIRIIGNSRSRAVVTAIARQSMQRIYVLTHVQLGELSHQTVAIEPWEEAVAWAYPSIRWDPEPVLQEYAAYTPRLDQLDSSFLRSDAAPNRILEQRPIAIDNRDPFFEPPTTWITMMCRYTQLNATAQWQILQRVPYRCSGFHPIKQMRAVFGQTVLVPHVPAGDALAARFIGLPLSLEYKVSSLLLKPPAADITTSLGTFRFIIGTASEFHLLRAPPSIGYSAPYEPSTINSFDLTGAGVPSGEGSYTVEFYSFDVVPHEHRSA